MKKPLLILTFFLTCSHVWAVPNFFTYSSYLADSNRKPRALSGQMVYFRLFADSVGGTKIWEEPHGVVAPNGFISVQLGTNPTYPLPVRQIQSAPALWLEMQIYGESAFPRQKIATSFFAIAANYADSARHTVLADSAKRAAHAVLSDTAAYARGGSAVVSAQRADSARKAGSADSLGGFAAGRYVQADTNGFMLVVGASASIRLDRNDPVWGPAISLYRKNQNKWLLHGGYSGTDRFALVDSSGSERFTVLQNGNLGIGSASPQNKLSVEGSGDWTGIEIKGTSPSGAGAYLKMSSSGGVNKGLQVYADSRTSENSLSLESGFDKAFNFTDENGSPLLLIKRNGRVGIGTTGPAGTLDVNGTARSAAFYTDRGEGSLSGGDSTRAVISGLDDHTAYLVTASMNAPNCEICVSGMVTTSNSNTIAQAVELSSVDYQTGSVRIRRFEDRAAASYSTGNGNKMEIEFSARDVTSTAYWFWTITQISTKTN